MGTAQSRALGAAGINIAFLIAQVLGRRFSAVFGFETQADADRAAAILKSSTPAPRARKTATRKKAARKAPSRKRSKRR